MGVVGSHTPQTLSVERAVKKRWPRASDELDPRLIPRVETYLLFAQFGLVQELLLGDVQSLLHGCEIGSVLVPRIYEHNTF